MQPLFSSCKQPCIGRLAPKHVEAPARSRLYVQLADITRQATQLRLGPAIIAAQPHNATSSNEIISADRPLAQPWAIVDYHTKKARRKTGVSSDRHGEEGADVLEPLQFKHAAKMQLAIKVDTCFSCLPGRCLLCAHAMQQIQNTTCSRNALLCLQWQSHKSRLHTCM